MSVPLFTESSIQKAMKNQTATGPIKIGNKARMTTKTPFQLLKDIHDSSIDEKQMIDEVTDLEKGLDSRINEKRVLINSNDEHIR